MTFEERLKTIQTLPNPTETALRNVLGKFREFAGASEENNRYIQLIKTLDAAKKHHLQVASYCDRKDWTYYGITYLTDMGCFYLPMEKWNLFLDINGELFSSDYCHKFSTTSPYVQLDETFNVYHQFFEGYSSGYETEEDRVAKLKLLEKSYDNLVAFEKKVYEDIDRQIAIKKGE